MIVGLIFSRGPLQLVVRQLVEALDVRMYAGRTAGCPAQHSCACIVPPFLSAMYPNGGYLDGCLVSASSASVSRGTSSAHTRKSWLGVTPSIAPMVMSIAVCLSLGAYLSRALALLKTQVCTSATTRSPRTGRRSCTWSSRVGAR